MEAKSWLFSCCLWAFKLLSLLQSLGNGYGLFVFIYWWADTLYLENDANRYSL
jgi:hypothetical protein